MEPVGFILRALAMTLVSGAAMAATQAIMVSGSDDPVPIYRGLDGQLRTKAAPHNILCKAGNGDEIEILRGAALEGGREFWLLVRVLSGPCVGTEGWIRGTHARNRS